MNYGISILFRAIPLLMALFCFGYGAFVLHEGLDSAKFVAGPVVLPCSPQRQQSLDKLFIPTIR